MALDRVACRNPQTPSGGMVNRVQGGRGAPHQTAKQRRRRRFAAAHRNMSDVVDGAPNAEPPPKNVRWNLVGALLAQRFLWLYRGGFGTRRRPYHVRNRASPVKPARAAAGLAEQAPPLRESAPLQGYFRRAAESAHRSGYVLLRRWGRGSGPATSRSVRRERRIFLQA